MELRRYLDVIARQRSMIAAAIIVTALAAMLVSALRPKVYEATATVLLHPNDPSEQLDPTASGLQVINDPDRYVAEQVAIANGGAVARDAASQLAGLRVEELSNKVKATQVITTNAIEIAAKDANPDRARDIANTVARSYIENRRQAAVSKLQKSSDGIQRNIAELQDRITRLDGEIARATASGTSPEALKAARASTVAQYESLLGRQQVLLANMNLKRGEAELVEEATVPTSPVSPKPLRTGAFGAFVGLLLGLGVALVREQLSEQVRSVSEAEQLTGLPAVGELPFDRMLKSEPDRIAAFHDPQGDYAEAIRSLRTSLQLSAGASPLRRLVVTSPAPIDGRSTVAVNLAVSYALSGAKTVLVSADLRWPRVDALLPHHTPATGLSDLITRLEVPSNGEGGREGEDDGDQGQASSAIANAVAASLVTTPVPNLLLLPSGPIPPNPAELLSSRRCARVFDAVGGLADMVVIDTPPVLAVTDAVVLAPKSDGVVLVASVGLTERTEAQRAKRVLANAQVRLLGLVVNRVPGAGSGEVRRGRQQPPRLLPTLDPASPSPHGRYRPPTLPKGLPRWRSRPDRAEQSSPTGQLRQMSAASRLGRLS